MKVLFTKKKVLYFKESIKFQRKSYKLKKALCFAYWMLSRESDKPHRFKMSNLV